MWKVTGAIWEKLVVAVERGIYQQFRQPERLRLLNRNCVARSDQTLASIGKAAWSRKALDSQSRAPRVEWLRTVDTTLLLSLESRSSGTVLDDFSFWRLEGTIRAGIDVTFVVCHWLVDSRSSQDSLLCNGFCLLFFFFFKQMCFYRESPWILEHPHGTVLTLRTTNLGFAEGFCYSWVACKPKPQINHTLLQCDLTLDKK